MSENPFDLTGKVVLVTGANSGLGLAWANAAARAGADMVIWGRRQDANEAAAESIAAHGGRVLPQVVDVADEARVIEAFGEALAELGRIDGVIASAGIHTLPPSFGELGTNLWRQLLDINLDGAFYTLRESVRHMSARADAGDPGGSIVVCGSLSVTNGVPQIAHYAAAKGALASVTRSLAVEYGPQGIRANKVLPGRIATDLALQSVRERAARDPSAEDAFAERVARVPIARWGTPEDCAGIVVYLLSDASEYHTGDLITVDGGLAVTLP
jgi:NAD(P)-dependent dehydrogenase (short-subunit alcohol dehydrogenase family)